MTPPEKHERIHELWDALATLPASRPDEALALLLASLGSLVDSDISYWVAMCRLPPVSGGDQIARWHMGPVFNDRPKTDAVDRHWQTIKDPTPGHPAEWLLANLATAGRFRASRLGNCTLAAGFAPDLYRQDLRNHGLRDALCIATPINEDTEVCIGFYRSEHQQDFNDYDLELVRYGLRSLAWFHRRVLLSHGLLLADKPLTRMERRVLHNLLTDCSEKQIAEELNQKMDTTHKHVGSIYRKFGVNSRAGLMSVWLGQDPAQVLE